MRVVRLGMSFSLISDVMMFKGHSWYSLSEAPNDLRSILCHQHHAFIGSAVKFPDERLSMKPSAALQ